MICTYTKDYKDLKIQNKAHHRLIKYKNEWTGDKGVKMMKCLLLTCPWFLKLHNLKSDYKIIN